MTTSCCKSQPKKKTRTDWLLWGSTGILVVSYLTYWIIPDKVSEIASLSTFITSTFQLLNQMAWGLFLGIIFFGILDNVPREFVTSILGRGGTFSGIIRATGAGVLLDLCSHGILMVGMKLYERGASLGQVMAFLIASPWNSFSLTLILWALVGFQWMMVFLLFSMFVAIISGWIFEKLVATKILPKNPHQQPHNENFHFWKEAKIGFLQADFSFSFFGSMLWNGIKGSRMILRWIFFGVILASLIRTFVSIDHFQTFFGATLSGLGLTVLVATIIEVCSEGSTPIAADLLTRAKAPGNAFAFLMTGVSTDYTEVILLRETTKSWKIALFLPLVTVPQVIFLAWVMNQVGIV